MNRCIFPGALTATLLWLVLLTARLHGAPLTGDAWTTQLAPLTSRVLTSVSMKGTEYWATGEEGIFKSTNLTTWTKVTTTGLTDLLSCIKWTGSNFVATGIGLWTSPDGASWTFRTSFFPSIASSLAVRGTTVVGVGVLGTIVRSTDGGVTWTRQDSGIQTALMGVTATGARFIAVGENGMVLNSADGTVWAQRNSNTTAFLADVTVTGGRVVAVGDDATILVSNDHGDTWTGSAVPGATGYHLSGVAGDSAGTVMCGPAGSLVYTTDPANFATLQLIEVPQCQAPLQNVVRGTSGWVCAGACGNLLTSTNGTSWTLRSPTVSYNYLAAARTSSHFLAAGWPGDKVGRSTDGIAWTFTNSNQSSSDVHPITALVWAPSPAKLVAGTAGGRILSSSAADGGGLTARTSGTSQRINGGCWTGTQFIMVGDANFAVNPPVPAVILTSPNGNTWTGRSSGLLASLFGAASNGSLHVACGGSLNPAGAWGIILTSTDGIGWTEAASPEWPVLAVAWNGSLFAGVGAVGSIVTSPDGLTWTERTVEGEDGPWEGSLGSVVWAGTNWVAAGSDGDVALSTDGLTWKVRRYVGGTTLSAVTYGASKAVAAGEAGQILTSVSAPASLPGFRVQPMSQTLPAGQVGAIGVIATGTPTLRYQWSRDGVELPGETRQAVAIFDGAAQLSGTYQVVVSNDAGSVTSTAGTIRVAASPVFLDQTQGEQAVPDGGSVSLTATAAGAGPIAYQWFKSGTGLLAGRTASTLILANAAATTAGTYYLEATNEYGTSSTATIPVVVLPTLLNALDLAAGTVVTTGGLDGASEWLGTGSTHHDGTDSATSGTTPAYGQSWMEMTVSGVSSVSFWWNASSESCCDHLRFHIDGLEQDRISGTGVWTQKTYPLGTSGSHVIRWDYTKDGSATGGQDRGWVDQITFTISPAADFPLWAAAVNLPAARRGAHDTNGPLLLDNTLSYALGINPLTSTAAALPSLTRSGNTLTFRYTRGRRVPGVIYRVEWSADPATAVWNNAGVTESQTSLTATQETWTAQLVTPPATPRIFLRLRVSLSTP